MISLRKNYKTYSDTYLVPIMMIDECHMSCIENNYGFFLILLKNYKMLKFKMNSYLLTAVN